jgi:hypothetical protein
VAGSEITTGMVTDDAVIPVARWTRAGRDRGLATDPGPPVTPER